MKRYFSQRRIWTVLLATVLLCGASSAWSQTPEARLKAAYALNFAKFTHWPGKSTADALDVCVVGRSLVGQALEGSATTRVAGRELRVNYTRLPGNVSGCDLLFVSELDPTRARRILTALKAYPMLTVSDIKGYARNGGMIELVVVDKKLRFEIDLDAVQAAGLRLDPKLLELANRIYKRTGAEE